MDYKQELELLKEYMGYYIYFNARKQENKYIEMLPLTIGDLYYKFIDVLTFEEYKKKK